MLSTSCSHRGTALTAISLVSHNPYVSANRNWVSPFDSSGFGEFFDTSKRHHVHDERGLGKAELDESGDFRWKCNVSGYL